MEGASIARPQTKKRPLAACAAILAAGTLWGIIGIWSRRLMAAGLSPGSIVLLRNLGGAVLLSAVLALRDRSVFRVEKAHLKYFFGTGVVSIILFTVCYFSCQQVCSLALASILLYTAPAIVMLLSATFVARTTFRRPGGAGASARSCSDALNEPCSFNSKASCGSESFSICAQTSISRIPGRKTSRSPSISR